MASFIDTGIRGTGSANAIGEMATVTLKPDAGSSGPGKLWGRFQRADEDALGIEYEYLDEQGNQITIADDNIQIFPFGELWILVATLDGDTAPSIWYSTDKTRAWARGAAEQILVTPAKLAMTLTTFIPVVS